MKDLAKYLVTLVVGDSDSVVISEQVENDVIHLTATVPAESMGKIIGKNGRVIQSVRLLLNTAAAKSAQKVFLNLGEPEEKS